MEVSEPQLFGHVVAQALAPSPARLLPQEDTHCPTCGQSGTPPEEGAPSRTYIYALGRIEVRFRSLALEKEFLQVAGRADTAGLTDAQVLHQVLSQRQNRYLARQLCYLLSIEGLETYILQPRDPADFDVLIDALRPAPSPVDVDVVVGLLGRLAPPELCGGLSVPVVGFSQIYSFDRDALIGSVPAPERQEAHEEAQFRATVAEVLDRIMQMADNTGGTDEHRALNYLAVRYPAIYTQASEAHHRNSSLSGIEVRPSRLSGVRTIVDVIFSFTNRTTDVTEKFFTRVDVSEEFPFLVTKLSPYYDR